MIIAALGKMLSWSAMRHSFSPRAHATAVANLDLLFPLAIRRMQREPERPGDRGRISAIHHFDAPMPFEGEVLRAKMMVKETVDSNQSNPLYTVAAVEIGKPASERGESLPEGERSPAPPAGFDERLSQMVEAVKSGMRGGAYSRQPNANSNEPVQEYDDPYARLTVRPGTVEAQRVAGRAALDSLSRRFGLDSVSRRFDRAAIGQDTVLGSRLFANFRAGKPNALVGQTITSTADLAALAQVYRDPRFETLRLFLDHNEYAVIDRDGATKVIPAPELAGTDFRSQPERHHLLQGFWIASPRT